MARSEWPAWDSASREGSRSGRTPEMQLRSRTTRVVLDLAGPRSLTGRASLRPPSPPERTTRKRIVQIARRKSQATGWNRWTPLGSSDLKRNAAPGQGRNEAPSRRPVTDEFASLRRAVPFDLSPSAPPGITTSPSSNSLHRPPLCLLSPREQVVRVIRRPI